MDRFISAFEAVRDGDLMISTSRGVAWQADMQANPAVYDADYFAKIAAYEGGAIAAAVNAGRCDFLGRHLRPDAAVLDIGAGGGGFLRAAAARGFEMKGFDVMPQAAQRLRDAGCWAADPRPFHAVTLWDTIEHMETPAKVLDGIRDDAVLFASVPVFDDLRRIRESKHYRPGEHLYYFSTQGFIDWMRLYRFRFLERSDHETHAGRESIGAFAFRRDLPVNDEPRHECGGEMQLDRYDHPLRKTEYFMRCRECWGFSTSAETPEEAERIWRGAAAA